MKRLLKDSGGEYRARAMSYVKATLVVAFFNELYFYPFESPFRFSASIIVLNVLLLMFNKLKPHVLAVGAGLAILLGRLVIGGLWAGMAYPVVFLPSLIYYGVFGGLHSLQRRRKWLGTGVAFVAIDAISNMTEAFVRGTLDFKLFQFVVLTAVLRTFAAHLIVYFVARQSALLNTQAHQKRYNEMNIIFSNIQAEAFYLEKSACDIERLMKESYALYNALSGSSEYAGMALDISRGVHEVKKDYLRVLSGLTKFSKNHQTQQVMPLKDALSIVRANTDALLEHLDLPYAIDVRYHRNGRGTLNEPYAFFTVVNNLIINAIEAARRPVVIDVVVSVHGTGLKIYVTDTGDGIDADVLPLIYTPGFTTKFEEGTSSGMGLSHVKSIVERFTGTIKVDSRPTKTIFEIQIPNFVQRGERGHGQ